MFLKKNKIKVLLFLICLLGFFLRIWQINQTPSSLNWDEVSHGYNAYSILETGKDEWGARWPTIFRAYGDYKLPIYIYLTAASEAVFGLNEFAVRFPSVIAGVLSVLFTYLLVKKLFKNDLVAMLSSFFLAISPWHIFLSRPAFEANLASFLVISGIYLFLVGLEKEWFLPFSILFLGLSVHSYNSARIFVPLILVVLSFLYYSAVIKWVQKRRKELVIVVILLLIFFVPLLISFISPEGQARFKWVTIIDQGTINRINEARSASTLPGPITELIHNKATYFVAIFTQNYLSNFSPVYLFFKGGSNFQYNIPGKGIIYPIQAPFILLGLYWVFKNLQKKESKLILLWWLLAIIPAAATRDNPHVLRTILVLPVPQILTAVGIRQGWQWVKVRWIRWAGTIVYVVALVIFVWSFLANYFGSYRRNYSWAWQYGYKEVANNIQLHYNKYERIFMTKKYGEPHEFLLFYLKWDPEKYQSDPNLVRYFRTDWYWVDSFDKFIFINDWEIKEKVKSQKSKVKSLLITSPGNYPEGWSKIETINFLDGKPAFEILEF